MAREGAILVQVCTNESDCCSGWFWHGGVLVVSAGFGFSGEIAELFGKWEIVWLEEKKVDLISKIKSENERRRKPGRISLRVMGFSDFDLIMLVLD